jgi:L-lysine 2,3-aminomutase
MNTTPPLHVLAFSQEQYNQFVSNQNLHSVVRLSMMDHVQGIRAHTMTLVILPDAMVRREAHEILAVWVQLGGTYINLDWDHVHGRDDIPRSLRPEVPAAVRAVEK